MSDRGRPPVRIFRQGGRPGVELTGHVCGQGMALDAESVTSLLRAHAAMMRDKGADAIDQAINEGVLTGEQCVAALAGFLEKSADQIDLFAIRSITEAAQGDAAVGLPQRVWNARLRDLCRPGWWSANLRRSTGR